MSKRINCTFTEAQLQHLIGALALYQNDTFEDPEEARWRHLTIKQWRAFQAMKEKFEIGLHSDGQNDFQMSHLYEKEEGEYVI